MGSEISNCPVCDLALTKHTFSGDRHHCVCPRCGDYWVGRELKDDNSLKKGDLPILLSAWVHEQRTLGENSPTINNHTLEMLSTKKIPTPHECADNILQLVAKKSNRLNDVVNLRDPTFLAVGYCKDWGEFSFLINLILDEKGFIGQSPGQTSTCSPFIILPNGYEYLNQLNRKRPDSSQAFVAMSFAPNMRDVYTEGLDPAIRDAGFNPRLVSQVEHNKKICDQIVAEIKKSKFVVADFTGHRAGVYFEAGFAMGLGLETIFTCKKDDINELHFDIRQYNCIDWTDYKDLAKRLKTRIEAIIGRGPEHIVK